MTNYFSKIAVFIGAFAQSNATGLQLRSESAESKGEAEEPVVVDEPTDEVVQNTTCLVNWWNDADTGKKAKIRESASSAIGNLVFNKLKDCFSGDTVDHAQVESAYRAITAEGDRLEATKFFNEIQEKYMEE